MSNQQIAEAIFDKLYEDIAYTAKNPDEQPQAEMLNRLFRHLQVKKIREVLEKCQ
jgi:hypothetical protein